MLTCANTDVPKQDWNRLGFLPQNKLWYLNTLTLRIHTSLTGSVLKAIVQLLALFGVFLCAYSIKYKFPHHSFTGTSIIAGKNLINMPCFYKSFWYSLTAAFKYFACFHLTAASLLSAIYPRSSNPWPELVPISFLFSLRLFTFQCYTTSHGISSPPKCLSTTVMQ